MPRADLSHQVTLPTIVSHGLGSMDEPSEMASITTVPRSLSIHRSSVWPPTLGFLSHGRGMDENSNGVCVSPCICCHMYLIYSKPVDIIKDEKEFEGQIPLYHGSDHTDCYNKSWK